MAVQIDLGPNHIPGIRVPRGGSSCASCEYLADNKLDCTNKYFQKWNEGPRIPGKIDEYCSDWYSPKKGALSDVPNEIQQLVNVKK